PTLAAAAEVFLDRLAGGSFYVRLERRGLKGTIHSALVERGVGEHLYRRLEEQGRAARVDFADPDHVLAIETLGHHAGLDLFSRALRARHPFVRISLPARSGDAGRAEQVAAEPSVPDAGVADDVDDRRPSRAERTLERRADILRSRHVLAV